MEISCASFVVPACGPLFVFFPYTKRHIFCKKEAASTSIQVKKLHSKRCRCGRLIARALKKRFSGDY